MADTNVQDIYVAYYGRPADPGGASYWAERLNQTGGNLDAVIDAFGNSVEFTERFADLDTETLITAIYHRLFNRDPDAGGLAFYTGLLDSGQKTLGSIALDILNGTTGEDRVLLDEKLAVAAEFTRLVTASGTTYAGEHGITVGSNLIATIGSAWTEFHHEDSMSIAELLGRDPSVYYHEPEDIAAQFLVQLRDDPRYLDMDKYHDFGIAPDSSAELKFDDSLIIDGVLMASTKIDYDSDNYTLVDLAPGNYDFTLTGGTDTLLVLFANDHENGLEARRLIVFDEDHLQIRLLETVDLTVRVNGDAGSGDYRLVITETDDTYRAYNLNLEPSLDPIEPYEVFYDYLFGA